MPMHQQSSTEDLWFFFSLSFWLLSVVSLFFYCLYSCTHTVAQICALFTSSSPPCYMRVLSDLLDSSLIHFISYLFISLIFLLLLLAYTFYFLYVVDHKPAQYWRAGPPGQKEHLHRKIRAVRPRRRVESCKKKQFKLKE